MTGPHRTAARGRARGGPPSDTHPAAEGGGVALLTLCAGLVLLTAGLLGLSAVTDVSLAAARARTAADAAALGAVSAAPLAAPLPGGTAAAAGGGGGIGGAGGGCAVARDLALANGASLTSCSLPGPGAVLVEVVVRPRNPLARRIVGDLPARAAAMLEPQR